MSTQRVDYWRDPMAPIPTSRKTSASAFVRDDAGRLLLLRRTDNDLWTIPTGAVEPDETVGQAAVRETQEETGIQVAVVGLVGVFSTPEHVIAYIRDGVTREVRQPINVCVRARVTGGEIEPDPDEASEVRWVEPDQLNDYPVHPALRERIDHGFAGGEPHIT